MLPVGVEPRSFGSTLSLTASAGSGLWPTAACTPPAQRTADEGGCTAIVDDYRAGIRIIQGLADQYQASDYSIRMIPRTAGIPPRRRKIGKDQEQLVVAL